MRILQHDPDVEKGWYAGPWNSDLPISIGYANKAIDQPHLHTQVTEIYFVARGSAQLRLQAETVSLHAGDLAIIEPGEVHTFLDCSPDYFHLVIHIPGLAGEAARADKTLVAKDRLNL